MGTESRWFERTARGAAAWLKRGHVEGLPAWITLWLVVQQFTPIPPAAALSCAGVIAFGERGARLVLVTAPRRAKAAVCCRELGIRFAE